MAEQKHEGGLGRGGRKTGTGERRESSGGPGEQKRPVSQTKESNQPTPFRRRVVRVTPPLRNHSAGTPLPCVAPLRCLVPRQMRGCRRVARTSEIQSGKDESFAAAGMPTSGGVGCDLKMKAVHFYFLKKWNTKKITHCFHKFSCLELFVKYLCMSWCLPRFELKKSLAKAMTGMALGRTDRGLSGKDEPATLATKLEPAAPLRRCVGTIRRRSEPTENSHRVC